jgi:hypothetical protein
LLPARPTAMVALVSRMTNRESLLLALSSRSEPMRFSIFFPGLLAIACLCGQSCRDAAADGLKASVYIRYLGPERTLTAEMTIVKDSLSRLVAVKPAGGVAFLGSGMEAESLPAGTIRYRTSFRADYIRPMHFAFAYPAGSENRRIELDMSPLESFAVTRPPSLSGGMSLLLRGGLLEDDESIVFLFTGEDNETRTVIRQGPLRDSVLTLPAPTFSGFPPGLYDVYLVKKQEKQFTAGGVAVNSVVEYYSPERQVELRE